MKALVVYESMFGNTALVAEAIASGMRETMDVDLCGVQDAPSVPADDVGLIVAGGPTHAFSMSRTQTRTDAIAKGASEGKVDFGLREWIDGIPGGRHTSALVTFDTRVDKVRHLPGSAAKSAAKAGHKHGFKRDPARQNGCEGSGPPITLANAVETAGQRKDCGYMANFDQRACQDDPIVAEVEIRPLRLE